MKKTAMLFISLLMPMYVNASVLYENFGQFDPFTGGGSGIPNNAVASSSFSYENVDFTMALTATQRYCTEALVNDGNGTFTANAGISDKKCDNTATTPAAKWNFGLYLSIDSPNTTFGTFAQSISDQADFTVIFNYDTDPSANVSAGQWDVWASALMFSSNSNVFQTSQNLDFDWLDNPAFVIPPLIDFDPLAAGIFDLDMKAFARFEDDAGNPFAIVGTLGQVFIDVEVNSAQVPEPGSLLLIALAVLGFSQRRLLSR